MEEKVFTVYVTKYALTQGILRKEVSWNEQFPKMVTKRHGGLHGTEHYHKPDWHMTLEEAQERVRRVLAKEKAKLERKLAEFKQQEASALKVVEDEGD